MSYKPKKKNKVERITKFFVWVMLSAMLASTALSLVPFIQHLMK